MRAAAVGLPPVSPALGGQPAKRLWTDCVTRTNAARQTAGKVPLTVDLRLATAATSHSAYQAQQLTMSHVGPQGLSDAGQRSTAAGYTWTAWGENVAAGQPDCTSVLAAWMGSSSHRANILNGTFRHIGIGCIEGANGVRYWTMMLGAGG